MGEPLRTAIVGVGWAGTRHVEAIRELNRKVVVECLVDNDAEFLVRKSAELSVPKTYTDLKQALDDPLVDAVDICLPHALHCSTAIEAAAAGKHILCEKPIALTVEDASRMLRAARDNDVRLYVAENEPYKPINRVLRDIVRTGQYTGELTFASLVSGFRAPNFGYPDRREWLTQPERGGTGTWMLHGIHTVAHLRFILGEVETVYLREHKGSSFARRELEGTVSGLMTMASGIHVSVVQTCETRLPANLGGYTLHGERGSVRVGRDGIEVFGENIEPGQEPLIIPVPEDGLSDYAQEIEAFADYVSGVAVGPTTAESERRSLAVVQAGYESIESGVPVDLRKRFGDL
jgi:UDP-N-acetyl-2-amino-2-deoxyglucuronate dehydrogenase